MATKPAQTQVCPELALNLRGIAKAIEAGHPWKDRSAQALRMAADEIEHLSLLPAQEWRDIGTAPKDGTEFLGLNTRATVVGYRVVYFDDDAKEPYIWHVEDAGKGFNHHRDFLTHWMPLPTPPSIEKSGGEK